MPLKLGVVPYLNALPLYFSLRERHDVEIVADFPARLGTRLQNGEFDAALLPVADHIRGIGDGILGDAIVGATREVRSVLLFSKSEIENIKTVALDTSSHSSVALTRVLFRDLVKTNPHFIDATPDLETMLENADAALLIGDPALLAAQNCDFKIYDLATLWHDLTSLSFVFAAWTARTDLQNRAEIAGLLNNARDDGRTRINEIVAANLIKTSLPKTLITDYLRETIEYQMSASHRAGLEEFARRLHNNSMLSL
jgi:chorismate dehydratase